MMRITTKQRIQSTALDLFSTRGFSAVSIRDICKLVGIKESTVYYHFIDKQDIFESLLREVEEVSHTLAEAFNQAIASVQTVEEEPFVMVGLSFLNNYLLDGHILKFIRMLMIEQHVNEKAATLYRRIVFEAPLAQNEAVFALLMRMGCFAQADCSYLSREYYAPIFLVFQRYFSGGEVTEDKRSLANQQVAAHLRCFYQKYSITKNV